MKDNALHMSMNEPEDFSDKKKTSIVQHVRKGHLTECQRHCLHDVPHIDTKNDAITAVVITVVVLIF